jgi:hypothetical protein
VGGTSGLGARGGRVRLASRAVGDSNTVGDGDHCLGRLFGAVVDGDGGVRKRRTAARSGRYTRHRGTGDRIDRNIARGGRHAAGRDGHRGGGGGGVARWTLCNRGGGRGGVARRTLCKRGGGGGVARILSFLRRRASCSSSREGDVSVLHRESKKSVASTVVIVDKIGVVGSDKKELVEKVSDEDRTNGDPPEAVIKRVLGGWRVKEIRRWHATYTEAVRGVGVC